MATSGEDLSAATVPEFLDRLADRTPTPGGGSVAAVAGALSCALARMVAAYSNRAGDQAAGIGRCLENADRMLRTLLAEDIAAYQALSAATTEAKIDPQAESRRQTALLTAALVPLEIAATATTALAAMDELKSLVSKGLLSDLGAAAVIGEACVRASRGLVRVNLAGITDTTRSRESAAEIERLVTRAGGLRASIEAFVDQHL